MVAHVSAIVTELVELVGSQNKLAKRLKISQPSISRFIAGEQEPRRPQWERISALYMELKGWRFESVDEQLKWYDLRTEEHAREVLEVFLRRYQRLTSPRR